MVALSGPLEVDLEVYRGDTGRFRLTVTTDEVPPVPVDVSGATWDADIRANAAATASISNFDVVPVEGDTSSVDVILSQASADLLTAGTLYYDVEMRLGTEVVTLIGGKLTVTQDVSRAV